MHENRPGVDLERSGVEWRFWDAPRHVLWKCSDWQEWKLINGECALQHFAAVSRHRNCLWKLGVKGGSPQRLKKTFLTKK